MLMRFDPFRELDRLSTQLVGRQPVIPMDAYRDGDRFVVHFDMPGVDPASIDLSVEKNVLTVRAERRWQPSDHQDVVVSERPQGTFVRQLFLGDALEVDGIDANYDNGVLTVTVPVAEAAKPRKVEIGTGGSHPKAITAESRAA